MIRLRPYSRLAIVLILLILCAGKPSILGAAPTGQSEQLRLSIEAGYDGAYRHTAWVPLQIGVANSGPPVEGTLRVTVRSSASVDYVTPVSLPTQSERVVQTYVYLPRFTDRVTVDLLNEANETIASADSAPLRRVDDETLLYAVAAPVVGELTFLETVTGTRSDAMVAAVDLEDLPPIAAAWQALDVLVLNNVDSGQLSADQRGAMDAWIALGGQLVVTGGANWQSTTAGLAEWLPVSVTGTATIADLPALAGAFGIPLRDPGPYLVATGTLETGELLVHQNGLPLLATVSRGAGHVSYLALDPQLAPLADWDGSPLLWALVTALIPEQPFWAAGVRDVQAAGAAAGSLTSLQLPSGWLLLAFLLVYILAIGPVSYVVLKRRGRLELAWITTPALIVLFTFIAYVAGSQLRGNDAILNQLSIVSGSLDSPWLARQTLYGLYSPQRLRYDLTFPASELVRPFSTDNGDFWGGGLQDGVVRRDDVTIENILVDVSGVATLVSNGLAETPELFAELRLNAGSMDYEIVVTNRGSQPLETLTLIIGNQAVAIGDLPPGATWERAGRLTPPPGGSGATRTPAPFSSGAPAGYATLLGTQQYFQDQTVQARLQLLRSLEEPFGSTVKPLAPDAGYIVAWSEASMVNVQLNRTRTSETATTLYLLRLPVTPASQASDPAPTPEAFRPAPDEPLSLLVHSTPIPTTS